MASDIKRLAVILGQETFRIPGVEDRTGNEHDVKELESTLKKLGFSVRQYKDLNKQEILSVLTSISLEGIKNLECILVTVLTHGNSGGVLLAKDREFYTKDVWELFRDSEKFNDIPKIFIFQACRGRNEEKIFSFQSPKQGPQNCVASQTVPMLPHKPGFLLVHSTIADHVSKRNHDTGTIFIQTLCNELSAAHDQNGEINFLSLLTEVNNKVTTAAERDSGSQTSTFTSFLREPLILKTKNAVVVQKSAPATSKVSNDAERGSIRKAYEDVGTRLILILYTEKYQDKLLKLKLVLNRSHFTIQPILVKDIEVLNGLSRCTDFKKVGSLTVIVLAEICGLEVTGYCEQLYVKFSKFDVQLSAVWSEFTVSRCYELMGKPKLFFFCDLLDGTDHPEEMSIVNVGSVNNHSDFIWTYCFGERMFEELTYALCNSFGEITHLLTTAMRKSDSTSRNGGRISHFESTLRFQFYYRSLQQEMASLQLQEALLPKEIESHMKLKSSVGIPIEPVAYSSKYPDNTRTRDGQYGYEPQNASIVHKNDHTNQMEQTQQLVSSPAASLEERNTFKVNPQICSHQELNETSNSTYERSHEKPEIFERNRQEQVGRTRQTLGPPPERPQQSVSSNGPELGVASGHPLGPKPSMLNQKGRSSKWGTKRNSRDNTRKLTKADIGMPLNFRHISHIGWDPIKGFYFDNVEDPVLKEFFVKASVVESHCNDRETRDFIYDFINKHGGMEAVEESFNLPDLPQTVVPAQRQSGLPQPEFFRSESLRSEAKVAGVTGQVRKRRPAPPLPIQANQAVPVSSAKPPLPPRPPLPPPTQEEVAKMAPPPSP